MFYSVQIDDGFNAMQYEGHPKDWNSSRPGKKGQLTVASRFDHRAKICVISSWHALPPHSGPLSVDVRKHQANSLNKLTHLVIISSSAYSLLFVFQPKAIEFYIIISTSSRQQRPPP